jgi:hypothetical protein
MNYFEKTAKLCNVDTSGYEAIYQSVLKEFANDKNFNYFLNSLSSIEEKRDYVFSIGSLSGNTYFERKRTFTKDGGITVTYNLLDSGKNLPHLERKELMGMLIKDVVIGSQSSCTKLRINGVEKFSDSITFNASFDPNRDKKSLGQFRNPIQQFQLKN